MVASEHHGDGAVVVIRVWLEAGGAGADAVRARIIAAPADDDPTARHPAWAATAAGVDNVVAAVRDVLLALAAS